MAGSPNNAETIEYFFDPGQTVWIIQGCGSNSVVVQASVVRVIGVVTSTANPPIAVVTYNVSIASVPTSTVTVAEVDMFHSLADAVAEYEIRLT